MSDDNKIGDGSHVLKVPAGIVGETNEVVHIKPAAPEAKCDIHEWPTPGLARRLLQAMRARHLTGGINACPDCISRAREEAKTHVRKPDAS